jgi:hypothetical protein
MQPFRPIFEFHVSRQSRDQYAFDQTLFAYNGNVIFANFHAARVFAQKMNDQRDLIVHPEQAIKAGQIVAMGLIDEILHHIAEQYRQQKNPLALNKALDWLTARLGQGTIDAALKQFCDQFPPVPVYQGEISVDAYLDGETKGISHRQIALEEMLMLWLANANPAFEPYSELFDHASLSKKSAYTQIISQLEAFYETQPHFGPDNQSLFAVLRAPALTAPYSLSAQLDFIRQKWGTWLGGFLQQILNSLD